MSTESPHPEWVQTILDALKAELPAHIRAAHEQAIKAGDLPVTPRKYLGYNEAAHYLSMTPKALRCAVEQGAGPRYYKPGDRKVIRFTVEDLNAWMKARDSNA